MKYEIKVWNDPRNMAEIEPKNAAGLIQNIVNDANSVATDVNNVQNALRGNEAQEAPDPPHQPDILIDENGDSEEVIKSVEISYITKKDDNGNKIQSIKIEIKGNLYLPLDGGLAGDAKKLVGLRNKGEENQRRNTLLLSKWASAIQPDPNAPPPDPNVNNNQNADEPFYRAVAIRIMTKAGDFRVITAKKAYVESYSEDYEDGEFGSFEMTLIEKSDARADFKVKGVTKEKLSRLDKARNVVDKVAEGAAVVAVGSVLAKAGVETAEKIAGETPATRWIKYSLDTTSNAASVTNSSSKIFRNPKDPNTWIKEGANINKNVNDRIQKGVDAEEDIPLKKMEELYLGRIKKDPAKYADYLKMSQAKKYQALKDAAGEILDRATITRNMEEETRDYYKNENKKAEKESKNLSNKIDDAANKKNGKS